MGFPGDSVVKNSPAKAGDARDVGSILGLGRSPRVRNGNLLQYSCLGNLMGRGAWQATVCGIAKSRTWVTEHTHTQNTHSTNLPSETFLSVQFNSVAHFDATYFASLKSHTLPVTSKDIKSFIHVCRNHSSETKNLSDVLFCPLHPLTPLFQGIMLSGSRANGHSWWLCVFCRSEPPQLCLGCCVSMFTNLVRNLSTSSRWSPDRSLREPQLIWTPSTWWPWVWKTPWELACTSWLVNYPKWELDQQLSSASWWPPCLVWCLVSALLSLGPGYHALVLRISTAVSPWVSCVPSSLAGTSYCPMSLVRWWIEGRVWGFRSGN